MSNSSRPGQFATYSYYLAFASSGIVLIAFLASAVLRNSGFYNVVWLALITGGVGTFFALAARSDFKHQAATEEDERHVRVGLRVNLATLVFMLIIVIFVIVVSAIFS
jgi:hypothetical protein